MKKSKGFTGVVEELKHIFLQNPIISCEHPDVVKYYAEYRPFVTLFVPKDGVYTNYDNRSIENYIMSRGMSFKKANQVISDMIKEFEMDGVVKMDKVDLYDVKFNKDHGSTSDILHCLRFCYSVKKLSLIKIAQG